MKIRMLTSIGGTCDGQKLETGVVVDVGETAAHEFVARGMAEYVNEPKAAPAPEVVTAEAAPPLNAARRTTKPKPRGRPRKVTNG